MDDNADPTDYISNGIGPSIERTAIGPVAAHALWFKAWLNQVISFGFRDVSGIVGDRYEFGHAASIELEDNRNALGCAKCIVGGCDKLTHNSSY